MKYGVCYKCTNIIRKDNKYWCIKHNKIVNKEDTVVCAYYKLDELKEKLDKEFNIIE